MGRKMICNPKIQNFHKFDANSGFGTSSLSSLAYLFLTYVSILKSFQLGEAAKSHKLAMSSSPDVKSSPWKLRLKGLDNFFYLVLLFFLEIS